ncbi:hypothetical protein MAFF211471_53590 (plasmid) [Ralstonia solanacearum]|nr:hypothetical protein MAFF211471_53590 [Ralstonia solanacearum]BCN02835.1 hypothetical protein RPSA_53710 [Ralstonia solanacearum]BEU54919.1 hypothetical protein MAFF211520_52110 [Ralstonia pseudosolanacearum]BEU60172.1 hypothetical protein MAFF211521_52250 [Ralstonia pseudosolanacearum]
MPNVKRPPRSMPAKTAWLTRGVAETMWMLMEKRTTGICTTPYEGGKLRKNATKAALNSNG